MLRKEMVVFAAVSFIAMACKKDKKEIKQPVRPPVEVKDMQGTWLGYNDDKGISSARDLFLHVEGSTLVLHSPVLDGLNCKEPRNFTLEAEQLVLAASPNCLDVRYPIKRSYSSLDGHISLYLEIGDLDYSMSKHDTDFLQHSVSSGYSRRDDVPGPFQTYFIESQDDAALDAAVSEAQAWFRTLSFHIQGPVPESPGIDVIDGKLVQDAPEARCTIVALPALNNNNALFAQPLGSVTWYLPRRENNIWRLESSLREEEGKFVTDKIFSNTVNFSAAGAATLVHCSKPLTEGPWTLAELKAILVPAVFKESN